MRRDRELQRYQDTESCCRSRSYYPTWRVKHAAQADYPVRGGRDEATSHKRYYYKWGHNCRTSYKEVGWYHRLVEEEAENLLPRVTRRVKTSGLHRIGIMVEMIYTPWPRQDRGFWPWSWRMRLHLRKIAEARIKERYPQCWTHNDRRAQRRFVRAMKGDL